MSSDELLSILVFNRMTNYTPKQKLVLFEKYGCASNIFSHRTEAEEICKKPFMIGRKPLIIKEEREGVEQELRYYTENGIEVVDYRSEDYPESLRQIYDPPLVLFIQGEKKLLANELMVGVVGARRASNASINIAYSISKELSEAGAVVVSGLAFGVDYYSHKGALEGPGSTIAVLGNGIDRIYPKENRDMYARIRAKGLLLTEFALKTPSFKHNFPRRNRIISGLTLGTVVVEASRSSGALITASYALEQGREVMAFPGRAASDSFEGNNKLIKEGAHLVENSEDILSILGRDTRPRSTKKEADYSGLEKEVLTVIGDGTVSIEQIEKVLDKPISYILSALIMLELKGAVVQHPGKLFSRVYRYGE